MKGGDYINEIFAHGPGLGSAKPEEGPRCQWG